MARDQTKKGGGFLPAQRLQPQPAHPSERELESLMRGELKGARRQAVVRHMLTECPQCRSVTQQLYHLGNGAADPEGGAADDLGAGGQPGPPRRRPRRQGAARTVLESEAQVMLREVAGTLEEARGKLQGIVIGLPLSPQEKHDADLEEEPDITTEVRAVVRCVLKDSVESAITDLLAAADYKPAKPRTRKARPPSAPDPCLQGGGARIDLTDCEALFDSREENDLADAAGAESSWRRAKAGGS